jgi:hypothetical protein
LAGGRRCGGGRSGDDFGTPLAISRVTVREAAMAGEDITIEIIKAIRDEARQTRAEMREMKVEMDQRFDAVDQRFDGVDQRFDVIEERLALTNQRLDITNERLGVVESTMLTLARRQRTSIKA